MLSPRATTAVLATAALSSLAPLARADGSAIHAIRAPDVVSIDGLLREWSGEYTTLGHALQGAPSEGDIEGRALVSYDADNLYVAAEIRDDKLVANADHVELLLGIPGGTTRSVLLYPGVPGKSRAEAKLQRGGRIAGAEVVEAPLEGGGYSLEAKIPWQTFPEAKTVRIGLRGALFAHDADASTAEETVIGTAPSRNYADLPPLSTEPELALGQGLLREKRIWDPPSYNTMADVVGDGMSERILVYAHYLVVLGPTYRGGSEFYFRDIVADARKGQVPRLELRDVTGDGKADILMTREADGHASFEVLSFGASDVPDELLNDEFDGRAPQVSVGVAKGKTRITVTADSGPRTFELRDGAFAVVDDKRTGGGVAWPKPVPHSVPKPVPVPAPAPSPAGTPGPDLDAVYALYKKERGASGAPRFDFNANLAGDARAERVVVHDRDLVAFGPGFRDGRAYAAITLASFAKGSDITSVKARDVTGNGLAEVVVEGVMRAPLPESLGKGEVTRTVLLVYRLDTPSFKRVFAAETGRALGKGSVRATVRYTNGTIELAAGSATGFDATSYPFSQDQGANGGFEPLVLPWSGYGPLRYRFDGSQFVR